MNPHEKLTTLLAVPMPSDALEKIVFMAQRAGVSKSAYARHVLAFRAYGALAMLDQDAPVDCLASRSVSDAGGKCDGRLDIMITDDLADKVTALRISNAFNSNAEYVRYVLECHVFGEAVMMSRIARKNASFL